MPTKPATPCGQPGCPHLRPCPKHPRTPWAASTHNQRRTVSGWEEQRRQQRVLQRDRGICHRCGHPGADQADHVIPLTEQGPDDETNLAAIHGRRCPTCGARCHVDKTAEEAARGRGRTPRP